MKKRIFIIVAIATGGGFGYKNRLPWPKNGLDTKFFVSKTSNATLIMGRLTFESLDVSELTNILKRGCKLIIVSNSLDTDKLPTGAVMAGTLDAAIRAALTEEVYLIGGRGIYEEALQKNLAHIIYRTNIHQKFECDVFFPELGSEWYVDSEGEKIIDAKSKISTSFDILTNKNNPLPATV
jgi:dihydrofolate reductase